MSQLKMKRIVAYYATFTAVWLIASDKMVEIIFPDFAATFASVHAAKGMLFLVVSSGLLLVTLTAYEKNRKKQDAALQESERRFRLLVENSPDAFFLHDMCGTILDVNQRACEILGYNAQTLRGMHIWQVEVICPPETLQGIWSNLQPGSFSFDGLGRRRDGTTFPTEVQGVAFEEQGRMLALVAARDVTSRKKLEKELEQARDQAMAANRVKSEFLACMSHEIRTPLHILLGMAELLGETPLLASQRQFTDAIGKAGQKLLRLINDILDLSRIEAGRIELHLEMFCPRTLLQGLGEVMRVPIAQKGLQLQLRLADDLPQSIRSDPTRVEQVLTNLIWNAIKFTAQGRIEIGAGRSMSAEGLPCLRIFVEDTGIGIPADKRESIFNSFTQADTTTTRRYGGTGLGLAISRRLVELLGGRIQVDSTEGRGSCFSFTLPLADDLSESQAPADLRQPEAPPSGGGRIHRLLLVEDALPNRELLQLFLKGEPYEITTTSSGHAAMELFAGQAFDSILMDVEMPGMDGYETTTAIRRLEQASGLRRTPIIMLTAHDVTEVAPKGRLAGGDGFLSKPLRKDLLLRELQRLFDSGP